MTQISVQLYSFTVMAVDRDNVSMISVGVVSLQF